MTYVISFGDGDAAEHDRVGGKGANLGRLVHAGFEVPPGFTVTTDAYGDFLHGSGAMPQIDALLADVDYGDADTVEARTAEIRALIVAQELPAAIAAAIAAAHGALVTGDGAVAVRSSGTAEDLADASFAGMHDTYLDIRGLDGVLDAVRRCWASLWTARATAYRHDNGFDHRDARLAVVIQQLVAAEAAGVMFTVNPLSTAVDETVVNASWGLGEAVVSGIVTPDEHVVDRDTLRVKRSTLGSKSTRVVRNPAGQGTVEQPVAEADRARFALSDAQVSALAGLGRDVSAYYGGFPQDIEWALADGGFYLLQSRPVTGVELSWDEDLEDFHVGQHEEGGAHGEVIYTRAWSDDFSIAAITPLYYTTRSREWSDCYRTAQLLYGHDDVAAMRSWKYHKGEAYYSSTMEAAWTPRILPRYLRNAGSLNKIPPSWWQSVEDAPFSWAEYLKIYARIKLVDDSSGPYKYVKSFQARIDDVETANGLPDEQLCQLSDRAFQNHLRGRLELWKQADDDQWGAFFLYAPFAMGTLADFLVRWYDGDIGTAFADLLSGLPKPSITLVENHELWQFGERIKASPLLRRLLDEHEGAAFFEALREHDEGRAFLADYEPWRLKRGHRGSADRDFILPRRIDDPAIDFNAFKALMAGDSSDPLAKEAEHRDKRRQREEEVYAAIRSGPLGFLKLEAFKLLQSWALGFMAHRDDEREYLDRLAYVQRRCFLEMGRRLHERGQLAERDDVFFLGLEENFALLDGRANQALCAAKIAGRKRNFYKRQRLDVTLPFYLHADGTPALPGELIGLVSDQAVTGEDGRTVLPGAGTSSGLVRGRARVIRDMADIGTLEEGDILVCHATDPGWTPVFLVISGLVMQTGGVLAHGSCLSREYGLPAVVVPEAMSRIADGATIEIDGAAGHVVLLEDDPGRAIEDGADRSERREIDALPAAG